jgi:hypothetical protein
MSANKLPAADDDSFGVNLPKLAAPARNVKRRRAGLRRWPRARTAALSQTSRSTFAGMTVSEILNTDGGPDALRLIRRRAGHSRGP